MLYIVGTPIGNLKDVTLRALETLENADMIVCEDTRHSMPFLTNYDIRKPLSSYHKYNEKEETPRLIELLKQGKNIALISDAGMPCISDPGSILVKAAREAGIEINVVPGPTAVTSAISLAGISDGFVFIGFLSDKTKVAETQIRPFVDSPLSLVVYCSTHDLDETCKFLYENLGDRKLTVVKELTKLHETVAVTTLSKGYDGNPKGEFVFIVEGKNANNSAITLTPLEHLKAYIEMGMTKKEAVKKVAEERGVRKDDIYKIALELDK